VDYRTYHTVNLFVVHHPWIGRAFVEVETVGPILLAVATFGLWLLARPGAAPRWKLASASALASAALGLLVNQLIAEVWSRQRPFASHHAHVWGARSHDPSFPSDHASAAFAIAFTVLLFDHVTGALFVVTAVLVALGRVVVGAHYPGDVLAGCLVGLACAIVVVRFAQPFIAQLVRIAERLTDPLTAPVWRLLGRR
jgi:membrane-associated phospholipid phosphatase